VSLEPFDIDLFVIGGGCAPKKPFPAFGNLSSPLLHAVAAKTTMAAAPANDKRLTMATDYYP